MRSLLLLGPLLAACSPQGWIRTERGSDRIRTAYHFDTTLQGIPTHALVLANSHFPCSLPTEPDPDAITSAEQQYAMAWGREGAMLVAFALFEYDGEPSSGRFPVDEAASPYGLDEVEPRAALAAFHAVWEAEVVTEDGLYREYQPVIEEDHTPVDGPGSVELELGEEGRWSGRFALDAIDVSGRFEAEACAGDGAALFETLGIFSGGIDTDIPADTGRSYPAGGTP
jgi:hypothetical protein